MYINTRMYILIVDETNAHIIGMFWIIGYIRGSISLPLESYIYIYKIHHKAAYNRRITLDTINTSYPIDISYL